MDVMLLLFQSIWSDSSDNDLVNSMYNGLASTVANSVCTLGCIQSGPEHFEGLSFSSLMSSSMNSMSVWANNSVLESEDVSQVFTWMFHHMDVSQVFTQRSYLMPLLSLYHFESLRHLVLWVHQFWIMFLTLINILVQSLWVCLTTVEKSLSKSLTAFLHSYLVCFLTLV